MYIVENYSLAVIFCIITMLCWGSWGNTQKLASKTWRYELFYWDYVIGVLLLSLMMAFTLGSIGENGRNFLADIQQVKGEYFFSALLGGAIFNLSNILLSASVSIAGMAVAFPLGVGLALVLGVFINYFNTPKGDPLLLFIGVMLIVLAIVLNALAYKKKGNRDDKSSKTKGLILAIIAGVLMSTFYRFIASSMDLNNFNSPEIGKMTPYTAMFVFALGMFMSNFIINTIVMHKPFIGLPTSYKEYFKGNIRIHSVGILGGLIWGVGNLLSLIATEKAGAAISYGLGQGATMVAAFWGVFIWKEFKGSNKLVTYLLTAMFILFLSGLSFIIIAGNSAGAPESKISNEISVIFETDMANDVDDAMALDMLYKSMDDKKVKILAIMSNNSSPYSTRYIDIMNTWYGYSEIPIGKIVNGKDTIDDSVNYAKIVCNIQNEDKKQYFSESVKDSITEATKLYRKVLSAQKDNSVIIISVGFSTNLESLLNSEPDEFSPLTGIELVSKKVKLLSVMAGSFGENPIREFNVRVDINASKCVFEKWPGQIIVTPFEAGLKVEYPATSIENDFNWLTEKHPLIEAYKVYEEMPYNRPTWDLISVLYAINPSETFFIKSPPGFISIDEDGYSKFKPDSLGKHQYLTINSIQSKTVKNYFVETISRKPANK